jgi:hypothetical protein
MTLLRQPQFPKYNQPQEFGVLFDVGHNDACQAGNESNDKLPGFDRCSFFLPGSRKVLLRQVFESSEYPVQALSGRRWSSYAAAASRLPSDIAFRLRGLLQ